MAQDRPGLRAAAALGDRRARPDAEWVRRLTGRSSSEIEGWFAEVDERSEVEVAIREAHRAGGRSSYAQFRAPLELYALVRALRPRVVLETGVSSGVSSAHFLLALRANREGRLVSIDLPTRQASETLGRGESIVAIPPGRTSGWAVPMNLRKGWDLRLGSTERRLPPTLRELGRIDLFLHDDLHTPTHLAWELRELDQHLGPSAVVLADNTNWTGRAFDQFAHRHGLRPIRRRRSDLVGVAFAPPGESS
jgi:hypothetical protein